MQVTVNGITNADAQMKRIVKGLVAIQGSVIYVGSRVPYAFGQETGRHRKSGKLARKAGGSLYLERAYAEVMRDGKRDLGEGLTRVTAPGYWMLNRLAKWVRRLAREYAPVGTEAHVVKVRRKGIATGKTRMVRGRLRKSIHIERGARV